MKQFTDITLKELKMDFIPFFAKNGLFNGVQLNFKPLNEDKVYRKSNNEIVTYLPQDLALKLSIRETYEFGAILMETISSYLFNIRKKVMNKDLILFLKPKDSDIYAKVRITKHFFRKQVGKKTLGRYKIYMSLYKKTEEMDIEIVEFLFTKRDVSQMLLMLKNILGSNRDTNFGTLSASVIDAETDEVLKEREIIPFSKVDNAVLIKDVWLHGQEIFNLSYIVNELVYKLNIEKDFSPIYNKFRQLAFSYNKEIAEINIAKMDKYHYHIYSDFSYNNNGTMENRKVFFKIPLTRQNLATLFLGFDIQTIKHIEKDLDYSISGDTSKTDIVNNSNIVFHISTKESILGVGILQPGDKKRIKEPQLLFVGALKESYKESLNDAKEIIKKTKDGVVSVPLLESFEIEIKEHWEKMVKALSSAYTNEYLKREDGKKFDLTKFYVINRTNEGLIKYEFTFEANENNEIPLVMYIKKYRLKKSSEPLLLGEFRQPLLRRYIYQLLNSILYTLPYLSIYKFSKELKFKDLTGHYKFKNEQSIEFSATRDKKVEYGVQKEENNTLFGIMNVNYSIKLNTQDKNLLNLSAYNKLLNGFWLPFIGDSITLGGDRYITDLHTEVFVDTPLESTEWATVLYAGTIDTEYK
jgi:hypothetical protein